MDLFDEILSSMEESAKKKEEAKRQEEENLELPPPPDDYPDSVSVGGVPDAILEKAKEIDLDVEVSKVEPLSTDLF